MTGRIRLSTRRPLALMYHGFTTTPRHDPENLFVDVADLRAQLAGLRRRGWSPLSLDAYLHARTQRRRGFLVTADDGFVSFAEHGWPVLRDLGIPAVLFVPSALVGDRSRWLPDDQGEAILDADALRALTAEGVEIGVHGADHRSLAGLDRDELTRQVVHARRALADVTGTAPRVFAYPYGTWDAAAATAVQAAGYEAAFGVLRGDRRWAIPRVDVTARDTPAIFRVKCAPGYHRARSAATAHRAAGLARRVVERLAPTSRHAPCTGAHR